MAHRLKSAPLLGLVLLLGCGDAPPRPEQSPAAAEQPAAPERVIVDVQPTAEQQADLDTAVARADAVDKFSDPAGYKAAYEDALAVAQTIYSEPHPRLEDMRMEIAFGHFLLGDVQTALGMLQDALPVYVAGGADYADRRIEINNNLGVAFSQSGQVEKAIPHIEAAVAEWRVKFGDTPQLELSQGLDNLAMAYHVNGQPERVLSLNAEAIAITEGLPPGDIRNDNLVVQLGNRSKYLGEMERLEESLANSLALSGRLDELIGADNPRSAYMLSSLAANLVALGQNASAEDAARRALDLREAAYGRGSPETAVARSQLIQALMAQRRYSEAEPLARLNAKVLLEGRGPAAEQTLFARDLLHRIQFALGDQDTALTAMRADLDLMRTKTDRVTVEMFDATENLAHALLLAGRHGEVREVADVVLSAEGVDMSDPRVLATLLSDDLAAAHLDPEAARDPRAVRAQSESDAATAREILGTGTTGTRSETLRRARERVLAAAFARGDAEAALRAMQVQGTRGIAKARAKQLQRSRALSRADRARLVETQDLQERRSRYVAQSYQAASRGDADAAQEATAEIDAIDARLAALADGLADAADLTTVLGLQSLSSVRSSLPDDSALLLVTDTPYGFYAMAVSADGVAMQRRDAADARNMYAALTAQLKSGEPGKGGSVVFRDYGALLFGSDIRKVIADRPSLLAVTRGLSGQVPLSVAQLDDGTWLNERHDTAYLASLAELGARRSRPSAKVSNFIGVAMSEDMDAKDGAPDPDSGAGSGLLAFRNAGTARGLDALPPLPNAAPELRAMRASLAPERATLLAERRYTEADFRALDLASADLLVFATHALIPGEIEGLIEPALVLAKSEAGAPPRNDGLLSASEISELKLGADWVVLSACNSGSGTVDTPDALSGLAASFAYAGADALLVSHWPVRDDAARYVTERTLAYRQSGLSKAAALRRATEELRRDADVPGADDPSIWAPFVLVGR